MWLSLENIRKSVSSALTHLEIMASMDIYENVGSIHKYGRNEEIKKDIEEDIWEGGGIYVFPTISERLQVVSESDEDKEGGIGATSIVILGLNGDFKECTEVLELNGVTPVETVNKYIRVYRAYVDQTGNEFINIGKIDIGGLAIIGATNGQTLMAIYTIPVNKTGYLYSVFGMVGKKTSALVNVFLFIREYGKGWRMQNMIPLVSIGTNVTKFNFTFKQKLEPKTDIKLTADSDSNGVDVFGGFDILLIKHGR